MNADRFFELIDHPGSAREADRNDLEQLIRQYPYFSLAHMLLAKISAENNTAASNSFMQNALLVVPDREMFIDFLKIKEPKPSQEEWMISAASRSDIAVNGESNSVAEEASEEEMIRTEDDEGKATTTLEEQLQEKILEEEREEYDLWNKSGGTGSENAPVHDAIEEQDEEHFVIEEEFVLRTEVDEGKATATLEEQLQEKILEEEREEYDLWNKSGGTGSENAPVHDTIEEQDEEHFGIEEDPEIASSSVLEEEFVLQEKESWMKGEEKLQPESSSKEFKPVIAASSENSFEEPIAEEPLVEETVEEPATSFLPDKKASFVGWLQFFKKNKKKPEDSQRKQKKQTEIEAADPVSGAARSEVQDVSFMKEELEHIDKIVSEIKTGSFYKPSAENISAPDLAKKSMELDESVISETLAQIYEEQGIYDKAIRMYARLSLKYPEKMATFASRIKVLKKKKNNSV